MDVNLSARDGRKVDDLILISMHVTEEGHRARPADCRQPTIRCVGTEVDVLRDSICFTLFDVLYLAVCSMPATCNRKDVIKIVKTSF